MSTNDDLTMLTGDEWTTVAVLIAYEVAGRVAPIAIWVFVLERIMTFVGLFHAADPGVLDFFTTHSFNMTVFSPKLLRRNPPLFSLIPLVFADIPLHFNPLPTPSRLQRLLPSRIKLAAALVVTPFFALAHFQLFFHFQRLLQSTQKQLEVSPDLPAILGLLCIIVYGHLKVANFFCNAYQIQFVCGLHSIAWRLMGHLCLWSPVIYTAFLMRSVDGRVLYCVMTLVGVVTGVGVSLMHSKWVGWRNEMNRAFFFPFVFLAMTTIIIHAKTNGCLRKATKAWRVLEVMFCVLMAGQVVYTSKAVVLLLCMSLQE